jgi:hypothetical protein
MTSRDHIRNPAEWGVDQLKSANEAMGRAGHSLRSPAQDAPLPAVRRIDLTDLKDVLARGLSDFAAYRSEVMFLCIIYPVVGLLLAWLAFGYDLLPLLFPLAYGVVGDVLAKSGRSQKLRTAKILAIRASYRLRRGRICPARSVSVVAQLPSSPQTPWSTTGTFGGCRAPRAVECTRESDPRGLSSMSQLAPPRSSLARLRVRPSVASARRDSGAQSVGGCA